MFDGLRNYFNSYSRELPRNIPEAAFKSAVYSFAASILLSEGNIQVGVHCGVLAATISLVSGLTLPMFRRSFANAFDNMDWQHTALMMVVNFGVTQILVNSLTSCRVNLLASAFFSIGLNLFINGCEDRSVHHCPWFLLV